ncbi:MAG: TauD/TfdA family dioxygenase [Pseudomonadota bacterium]
MTELAVQRLTRAIGARITDIDCAHVTDEQFGAVERALHRYQLLVFSNQNLSPVEHADFMERFGELDRHPQELSARTTLPLEGHPRVELMANRPGNYGPRASLWHTDVTFRAEPPAVTSLYGIQVPVGCADTIWASMRQVYEDLSDSMKVLLSTLRVVHATAFVMRGADRDVYNPTAEADPQKAGPKAQYREEVVHPMVHRHAAGFDTLYVNPAFVSHIEDWTKAESNALLDFLYTRAVEPIYTYRHQWSSGDLVVWDNRCTMHYGVNDYEEEDTRILHRTTGASFEVTPA